MLRFGIFDRETRAAKVLAKDEVDDAGHCIRAIDRRGPVFQNLDAIDGRDGDEIEVYRTAIRRIVGSPAAIQEHQRRTVSQAAQIRARQTRLGVSDRRVEGDVSPADEIRGDMAHDVRCSERSAALDVLARDDLHR
jgi:hypothetical protein